VPASSSLMQSPSSVAVDGAGNLYLSESFNSVIRKVDAATGNIYTIAGTGTAGYRGDGGPAASADLNDSKDLAVDAAGNLYIADYLNNVIRKVNADTGVITTVAGNGFGASTNMTGFSGGNSGDNGPATSAELNGPNGIAVDSAGNLYIADTHNSVIRVVTGTAAPLNFATPTYLGAIDTADGAQTVTLSNIGNTPLTFQPFVAGTNAALTGSTVADCSSLTALQMAPGAVCTLGIEFVPTAAGSLAGSVNVVDNALNAASPGYATQAIAFSGTGVAQSLHHFTVTGLTNAVMGTLQTITVTAYNANNTVDTVYGGTVHFTSSDPSAVLPSDYTFLASDNGVHTFRVTLKKAGSQTVTVTDTSATATLTVSITVTDFSLPAAPSTVTVTLGQPATSTLTVTPISGFTGTISFTCAVPSSMLEASCSATSVQIPGSSLNSTLTVNTTASHKISAALKPNPWTTTPYGLLFSAMIVAANARDKKKWKRKLLFAFLPILMLIGIVSCGGSGSKKTDPGTPAGTYTLTVVATSGTATHTISIPVVVQ
jgi:hypothetical protein